MENKEQSAITAGQTRKINNVDFSKIPSSDEFQKIKVKPENRWFNSLMSLLIAVSGSCIGVIIAIVIKHFTSK
ncbi:MAG: hypothetical protein LBV37_01455 [Mycoplasmataceae bacterium]|jgi:hypothetical protein|nr:hypothetical protein [Mycoplasmataceae bacterium]